MSYSIVYSSKTGNTALLAQALRECLGEENCLSAWVRQKSCARK